jgi:hypothetical protein
LRNFSSSFSNLVIRTAMFLPRKGDLLSTKDLHVERSSVPG